MSDYTKRRVRGSLPYYAAARPPPPLLRQGTHQHRRRDVSAVKGIAVNRVLGSGCGKGVMGEVWRRAWADRLHAVVDGAGGVGHTHVYTHVYTHTHPHTHTSTRTHTHSHWPRAGVCLTPPSSFDLCNVCRTCRRPRGSKTCPYAPTCCSDWITRYGLTRLEGNVHSTVPTHIQAHTSTHPRTHTRYTCLERPWAWAAPPRIQAHQPPPLPRRCRHPGWRPRTHARWTQRRCGRTWPSYLTATSLR